MQQFVKVKRNTYISFYFSGYKLANKFPIFDFTSSKINYFKPFFM